MPLLWCFWMRRDDYLSPSEGDENCKSKKLQNISKVDDYLSPSEGDENHNIQPLHYHSPVQMITYLRVKETKTKSACAIPTTLT